MKIPLEPPSNPFASLVLTFLKPDKRQFNETVKQGAKEVLSMTLHALGNNLTAEPEPNQPTTKKQKE